MLRALISINLLATKNIVRFSHENVMMHPAFKVMDRHITLKDNITLKT